MQVVIMKFTCILMNTHNHDTGLHRIKSIHPVTGASQFDLKNDKPKVKRGKGHNLDLKIRVT